VAAGTEPKRERSSRSRATPCLQRVFEPCFERRFQNRAVNSWQSASGNPFFEESQFHFNRKIQSPQEKPRAQKDNDPMTQPVPPAPTLSRLAVDDPMPTPSGIKMFPPP
jgi:hypothetical protein